MALSDRLKTPPKPASICKFGDFYSQLSDDERKSIDAALETVGRPGGWRLRDVARQIRAEYPECSPSVEALDDAIRRHRSHGEACRGTH
jgi:hypothetical protein